MKIKWREFEMPAKVTVDQKTYSSTYGLFVAEPFERGFGHTIGNGLRRVLLNSIEGAAPVSVKIKGVEHEFSTIDGVREDVVEIVLALQKLVIQMDSNEPKKLLLEVERQGIVTAADFKPDPAIQIINPEMLIATLVKERDLMLEVTVRKGRGYVTVEEHITPDEDHEIGVILMDSLFSPVTRVSYKVENTRVGKRTDYERLIIEIFTKGSIAPEMALAEAAKIYRKHLNPFVHYFEVGRELQVDERKEKEEIEREKSSAEMQRKFALPITELDLSTRASRCLAKLKVQTIKDLASYSETDLLKVPNFGKTSLKEIKKKMSEMMGLALGMDLSTITVEK
ncbi:MAG: DNA-directed RNA polymerase subunit alpha [Planctomycetota bacterium]|nr:DNA-directed RNA polymerase subunit alpha [Planctomycetota bacterium]MDI6787473.1 DNA-directed RNA polymerase subunit alpha [Planctomycetota bacterium]